MAVSMGATTHRTDVFMKEASAVIYAQSKGIRRLTQRVGHLA